MESNLGKKLGQLDRHVRILVEAFEIDPQNIRTLLVSGTGHYIDKIRYVIENNLDESKRLRRHTLDCIQCIPKGELGGRAYETRVYKGMKDFFNGGTKQKVEYCERAKIGGIIGYVSGEIDVFVLTNENKWGSFLESNPSIHQNPLA
jgi:hypothetical protein